MISERALGVVRISPDPLWPWPRAAEPEAGQMARNGCSCLVRGLCLFCNLCCFCVSCFLERKPIPNTECVHPAVILDTANLFYVVQFGPSFDIHNGPFSFS